jgi:anti-anti-sigma factor
MDSEGVGEIVRGMKRAREAGGDLRLCGLSGEVAQIFEMTRLSQQIGVYPTPKKSEASWG